MGSNHGKSTPHLVPDTILRYRSYRQTVEPRRERKKSFYSETYFNRDLGHIRKSGISGSLLSPNQEKNKSKRDEARRSRMRNIEYMTSRYAGLSHY